MDGCEEQSAWRTEKAKRKYPRFRGDNLPAFGLSDHTRRSDNLKVNLFSWDSFRQSAYVLHHGDPPISIARNSRYQTTLTHLISTMKTFQIVTLFAMIAASMAFAPNAPKGEYFFGLSATKNGKKADIRLSSDCIVEIAKILDVDLRRYASLLHALSIALVNANIDTMWQIYRDYM